MSRVEYAQMHAHSKQSVNKLSGEGVFHKYVWRMERIVIKGLMSKPESLAKEAMKNGVSYVSVTDHNTIPNFDSSSKYISHLFKGEEWGQKNGHANFVGLEKPIDPECGYYSGLEPANPRDFRSATEDAKSMNAYVTINHPFKSDAWKWGDDSFQFADAIEIWNGRWNEENGKALLKWQDLLEKDVRIFAMAGNDFHVSRIFHLDSQVVGIRDSNNKEQFFESLKHGRYSLALSTKSPIAFLENDGEIRYDIVGFNKGLDMRVYTKRRSFIMKEMHQQGVLDTEVGDKFVRIELWEKGEPVSFSNPVFLD